MEHSVHLDAGALEDLQRIAAWIALDSPDEARRWLDRTWNAILTLRSFPRRCPLAPETELLSLEIRQLVVGDYRILFTVTAGEVRVRHIRHGARRPLGPDTGALGSGRRT